MVDTLGQRLTALILAGAAVLAVIMPLIEVVRYSFGEPPFAFYAEVLARPEVWRIIGATAQVALTTAALALLLGLAIALTLLSATPGLRRAFYLVFILSSFVPFIVRGYACVVILGAAGPINRLVGVLAQRDAILLGTFWGVVLTLLHALLPIAVIVISAAIDKTLSHNLRVAATLGAGPGQRFLNITLPRLAPSLVSAFLVVFVIAAGAFVAPAMVGGGRQTLAVQLVYIYHTHLMQPRLAAALAIVITCLLLLVVAVLAWFRALSTRPVPSGLLAAAAVFSQLAPASGNWIAVAGGMAIGYSALVVGTVIVLLPLLYVLAISLQPLPMLALPSEELSLRWYARVVGDRDWRDAAVTTLRISLLAGAMSVCLAAIAAEFGRRAGRVGASIIAALAMAPAVVPAIVLAIGYYVIFVRVGMIGSGTAVVIAHAAIALPVAYLLLSSALSRYDPGHEEVASSLGAGPIRRLLSIRLRLLAPAFAAAGLFAFLASFEEVVLALFLAGMDIRMIALKMWSVATQSIGPELAVPGTFLLCASLVVAAIALHIGGLAGRGDGIGHQTR